MTKKKAGMNQVEKSNKTARGTVTCDNSTMHLLKANDFVADVIRKKAAEQQFLIVNITVREDHRRTAARRLRPGG